MTPSIVGLICARGGSKGVPRKNLRRLGGKPLIAYAIETARQSALIDRVVVSTDDAEIAAVARDCGADVPFLRPAELAADNSPEWLVWRHAVTALASDRSQRPLEILVSVPPTSPLRSPDDVDRCIRLLLETDADVVFTMTEANRNPYFNMVGLDADGCAHMLMRSAVPLHRRQDAPAVYDMTTVAYAARASYIRKASTVLEGKVKAVVIPEERALDIDTLLDFEMAEWLITKRKVKI